MEAYMIRITAKREGFRRCGIAHGKTAVEYPEGKFTKKELEILKAESSLTVEIIETIEDKKKPPKD
jgi:hypothetical protein